MKTIFELCGSNPVAKDRSLVDACGRVYDLLVSSEEPMFESQISRELISPQVCGGNPVTHSSYVRTALEILVLEGLLRKEKAQYSK